MDERAIEDLYLECQEKLEEEGHGFTAWEVDFIEGLEVKMEERHLTEKELDKLREIYEERV